MCRVEVSPVLTNSSSVTTSTRSRGTVNLPSRSCRPTSSRRHREKYLEAFRVLSGRELG